MNLDKTIRQIAALDRLQTQLTSGKKPRKIAGKTTNELVPLTTSDIDRIVKEITILKNYSKNQYQR